MYPESNRAESENTYAWKLLLLLWIVKLFYPEVLIAYYIPALKFIRKLPTLLILLLFVSWISSNEGKKEGYFWLAFFLFSLFLSSVGAENTGRARLALRLVLEYYLLARMTLSYLKREEQVQKIFNLYIWSYIYLSVWGIVGFLTKGRAMIVWDFLLNEEDAFGPLMCIGFAVSSTLLLSGGGWQSRKKMLTWALLLSMVGVILSFARGTFLVFLTMVLFNLKKSGNFFKGLFVLFLLLSISFAVSTVFFPDNAFWKEMSTVSEGTKSGTGRDRKVLWSIAWEEFKANPILGVGPFNFGVVAGDYLNRVPDRRDYRVETIWGRALHNGYFQILCEGGVLGSFAFIMLLFNYRKRMRRVLCLAHMNGGGISIDSRLIYLSAINAGVMAFLLNAFFYDIIYYSWFYQLLILNQIVTRSPVDFS